MLYKVSELEGTLLDAAVWLALKRDFPTSPEAVYPDHWRPSTEWAHGGPIIERERMEVRPDTFCDWYAQTRLAVDGAGPTPLIAAMRAYVASKLGPEVELR